MTGAGEPPHGAAGNQASDAENADPTGAGSLRKMFVQGTEAIQTVRTDNLFQSLEERTLTEEEQRIIQQRVALQRKMFEEYERRERKRKVAELQDVCPDISGEEAEKALELCDGREDEAAAQLVSDAAFRLRVQAACGLIAAEPAPAPAAVAAPPARREGSSRSHRRSKPAGPRPKLVDPSTLSSNVFVGAFRGKGFKPPPKGRQPARKAAPATAAAKAAAAAASHSAEDEDTETEEEEEAQEQQEQQEQQGGAAGPLQELEPAQQQQPEQSDQQGASPALQHPLMPAGVLLWPQAQAAAQPAAAALEPQLAVGAPEPQRYVLVRADTLEAPSDSLLRSARRQLGEPSDSKLPLGTDATDAAAGGEPASVARSRPLPAVAEEELPEPEQPDAATDQQQQQQAQQEQQTQTQQQQLQAQQQAEAAEAGQSGSVQPSAAALAAMAKQLSKLDDGKARALLRRMGDASVRAAVLEQLGAFDPDRAAACFALLGDEADEWDEEGEEWEDASDDERQQPSTGQQQQQQQQGQDGEDAAAAEQVEEAPSAQRARSRRAAAAGARRAVKRAASAALSDSEATETEAEPSSDEEMGQGGSSDDDEFVAPRSSRRGKAPPAKRQARPSRAAKNAAAAAFVAMAAVSGGEEAGSDTEAEEAEAASLDDEAKRSQRQRRGGSQARGSRQQRASPSPAPSGAPAEGGSAPPSTKRQRTAEAQQGSAVAAAAFAAAAAAAAGQPVDSSGAAVHQEQPSGSAGGAEQPPARQQRAAAAAAPRTRAISATGHTCRGRVKQKSHKSADLVVAGRLRAEKGWFNAGYIFPEGFQSRTLFRSSVAIDQLCVHECHIIGEGGQFWPAPTFKVVALDRPDEPLIAKSCTGCWTGILKRINAEIEARRRAGEDLPPPPKTAIAGPEYFGLNQPNIQAAVEALDPQHLCTEYWAGKEDRMAAAAGLPPVPGGAPRAQRAQRQPAASARRAGGGAGGSKRRRRGGGSDSEEGEGPEGEGEDDETQYMATKWSAVSRTERYRKRLQENGEDVSALDQDNPLPHFIDPITMSAVVRPAISPYGHVAGLATWKVVLAEKQQCPFTNQPLQFEQLKVLTKTNIHLWRDKIVNGPGQAPA